MEAVPITLQAGDMLFFNGSLIHGSYPNRSETRFRRAFICHYAPRHAEAMSQSYNTKYTFVGEPFDEIAPTTDGGPCGISEEMLAIH